MSDSFPVSLRKDNPQFLLNRLQHFLRKIINFISLSIYCEDNNQVIAASENAECDCERGGCALKYDIGSGMCDYSVESSAAIGDGYSE